MRRVGWTDVFGSHYVRLSDRLVDRSVSDTDGWFHPCYSIYDYRCSRDGKVYRRFSSSDSAGMPICFLVDLY